MNILKKIFSPISLIFSLLLFFFIFYKAEIFWNGFQRDYYISYYIISVVLIIFSIITFFINQKIKEYLIISVISLVVSLYLFEGFLIYKESLFKVVSYEKQLYKKKTGEKWDTRKEFEIYEDFKKKNNKVVMNVSPRNYENNSNPIFSLSGIVYPRNYENNSNPIFSLSGISNSEIINCNENGYYSINLSDRYGFNNPDEEWDSVETEYLLVGDSFTYGACVNRPNDIASNLRMLSKKSVLNLGYGGNGPLIEFATLREYLNSNVKKVLWIYYEGNDLENLLLFEQNQNILNNYLDDLNFTQNLKLKRNTINDLAIKHLIKEVKKKSEEKKEKSKFFNINKFIKFIKIEKIRISLNPYNNQVSTEKFKKILELTKDLTNKNNSKLYFVYLPEWRYKIENTNYASVKKIVKDLDVPFIDIYKEVFLKEENPLSLYPFEISHNHYSVGGYKKVAKTIYNFAKD